MIKKEIKLTIGLFLGLAIISTIPTKTTTVVTKISPEQTITRDIFSVGAMAQINESIVLDDLINNKEELNVENITYYNSAVVEKNIIPTVSLPLKENEYENIAIANVAAYLNIRAEANKESESLGKLYENGAAIVLGKEGDWYKVESGNVVGYLHADYVVVGDEEACKNASTKIGIVTEDNVRIRKEPSTDSEVYTLVELNDELRVIDDSNEEWIKIKYKEYIGYISSDYLDIKVRYTYAESKEEEKARLDEEARIKEEQRKKEEERRKEEQKKQEENKKQENDKKYEPPAGVNGQSVVDYAVQFVGNPYVWGGESLTKGADCSGFVMKVYEAFGVELPHSSYYLRSSGYAVKESDIQPGDIVCYSGHVAIYIGNGKIVHASSKKEGIIISNNWKYKKVLAIRRIF